MRRLRTHRQSTSSYESEQPSQSESEPEERKRPQQRFYKHSLDKLDLERIVLNVSRCHYPIVQQVARRLGWKVEQSTTDQNWDVCWMDGALQPEQLFRMHLHQKVNHFPGMYVIARKDCLGRALMRMRKHSPVEYDFFPLTWHLPSELGEFTVQFQQQKQRDKSTTYIVKPEASCQGKGIFLSRKLESITNSDDPCIVQRYLDRPYLISGLKFDFRIYVLLAGCDPMRIYLYNQGLARFATKPYIQPTKSNLKETYIHLTNYAINKDNPAFVFNTSSTNMNTGHKRSLQSVLKLLEGEGRDIEKLKQEINELIVKTIITGQPLLSHLYNLSQPENYANDMCFQILGFDVLLEEDCSPKLLEVNHTPSFVADTPLDESIKGNLIRDTLQLMNITTERKTTKVALSRQRQYLRSMRKKVKLTVREKHELKEAEQQERDAYEAQNLGQFVRIYPVDDATVMGRYNELLSISKSVFNKNNINNKKISTEAGKDQVSSPSLSPTLKSRVRALAPKEPQLKELVLKEVLVDAALVTSLPTLVARDSKEQKPIKSTLFELHELFTPSKKAKTEKTDSRKVSIRYSKQLDSDLRLSSCINQKIQYLENGGIEKALRSTHNKLDRLKKLSLHANTNPSPELAKIKKSRQVTPEHPKIPNSIGISANQTKGNFLAPRRIEMADMQHLSKDKTSSLRRNLNHYEKYMAEHDIAIARRLAPLQ